MAGPAVPSTPSLRCWDATASSDRCRCTRAITNLPHCCSSGASLRNFAHDRAKHLVYARERATPQLLVDPITHHPRCYRSQTHGGADPSVAMTTSTCRHSIRASDHFCGGPSGPAAEGRLVEIRHLSNRCDQIVYFRVDSFTNFRQQLSGRPFAAIAAAAGRRIGTLSLKEFVETALQRNTYQH